MSRYKKIVALVATLIITFGMAITATAEVEPVLKGGEVATYENGLTLEDCQKIRECFFAQNTLTTILGHYNRYTPMLMYQIETNEGYQYYCATLQPNLYGNSNQTITRNQSTFTFNGNSGVWVKYKWCDNAEHGWEYLGSQATTQVVSGVLYYRDSTGTGYNIFETIDCILGTDHIQGSAYTRYMAALGAFSNPTTSGDNGDYNTGYAAGYMAGVQEVESNPSIYNLYTAVELSQNYTSGQNSVINHPANYGLYTTAQYNQSYNNGYAEGYNIGLLNSDGNVTLDLPAIITGVTSAVGEIWQGFTLSGTTIFGISIAAICGSIILLMVILWVVKKLK